MFRDYNDPLYKKWRSDVRKRDNYQCQWPGCLASKKIQVHHIKRWSDSIDLRYHIDNGILLCKDHHKMIEKNESAYEAAFFKIIADKNNKKNDRL
jgi:predicted restriction endonuclease